MKLLKKIMGTLKYYKELIKTEWEVIKLTFTKDNRLVKNYVLLLMVGIIVPDDIPALFNMRDAVADALGLEELPEEWSK